MKRRTFIKKSLGAATLPVVLQGIPISAFAEKFSKMAAGSNNDRVVVMIQLMGGNDGLNTLVPINQYDKYKEFRPYISLPDQGSRKFILLNENDPLDQQLGLHPEMHHFKEMYDEDMVTIVQNVAYDNVDLSHFRGRDIWFMGGGADDHWHSGWMGRYLDSSFEGYPEEYPNDEMPDPLGLEFGYNMSLIYQREEGIPAGLAILDPETFNQLVSGSGVEPPEWLPDSYYGDEMQYLMDIELQSNQYAHRIKEVYDEGINSPNVTYPETYPGQVEEGYKKNDLAWQLQAVAKMISGGSKTKTFLVKLNGFDSHADQVLENDSTQGVHAALLYHLSSAVKAFYDDLKDQGLDQKVITITTSEFGRRVYDNASFGSDHGAAAPQFIFGPQLKQRVFGNPPNLSAIDDGNLKHEFDYRQIYTSLLVDWMGTSPEVIDDVRWSDFVDSRLDLFYTPDGIGEGKGFAEIGEVAVYPNPAREKTNVKFVLTKQGPVELSVYDLNGRRVRNIFNGQKQIGVHLFPVSLIGLRPGYYLIRLKSGIKVQSKKLVIQ
jgi:uncharacterized protein (DUF1501 family)